ncbi:proton-conducting transporter transmembrane domain-containing protein [Kineococcus terrestris]|uniref:proton-conducting transporter transmembrane domain-containing protein n=1 Tax=Kineococcus terrestris TaxID=2044856 RepID=UPI0034DB57BA
MNALLVAPVALPLLVAAVLLLLRGRLDPRAGTVLAAACTAVVVALGAVLLARTLDGQVPVTQLGGWPAGIAVVLVADAFSALLLVLTSAVVLLGLLYAFGTGEAGSEMFAPLVLVVSAGVSGVLLTGDLFNLFVFVEVVLVPSYVLLLLARGARAVGPGRLYVTVNLLASTVFLAGTGLVYGVAGTVQLGELAGAAREDGALALAAAPLLLAMAVKSAVVPLHTWLSPTYAAAGPAVVVLFSGLLTKVGLYVLFRLYAVLYDGDDRWLPVVLVLAVLTTVFGVLRAVGEHGARSVLLSHAVSQIGYVLVGLGLFTVAGLSAATFFLVQYVLVKAALFMVSGAVERRCGTDELSQLGGLVRTQLPLAAAFAASALALVGVPPTSGFVAKLQLATAAAAAGAWWVLAAVVAVSFVTLVSMLKLWNGVFWGEPGPASGPAARPAEGAGGGAVAVAAPARPSALQRAALVGPPLLLAATALVLGVAAGPLLSASDAAARALVDTGAWVAAVTAP